MLMWKCHGWFILKKKAVPENALKTLGLWQLKEGSFLIEDNREGGIFNLELHKIVAGQHELAGAVEAVDCQLYWHQDHSGSARKG